MSAPDEPFQTFDADGKPAGLRPRAEVHRLGLWHKSAQVFLFDDHGRLVLHQRAYDKDLYAGLWDHSVGEHLQPEETYLEGARRGLAEEFGIEGVMLEPLGAERKQAHKDPAGQWHDCEMQQAFRAHWHSRQHGALRPDAAEIAQVTLVAPAALLAWLRAKPAALTPWFEEDLRHFGLLTQR